MSRTTRKRILVFDHACCTSASSALSIHLLFALYRRIYDRTSPYKMTATRLSSRSSIQSTKIETAGPPGVWRCLARQICAENYNGSDRSTTLCESLLITWVSHSVDSEYYTSLLANMLPNGKFWLSRALPEIIRRAMPECEMSSVLA